jgi:UDP-glucose 4-epimerase
VYVSTVHIYGAAIKEGAVLDEATVPEPSVDYAIARLAAEHLMRTHARASDSVVLRLTNSVGAPVHPDVARWTLVGNDLCRQAATTGRLRLKTHGCQWRDFVAMADVCQVLTSCVAGEVAPGTYNVGSGKPATIRELAEIVQDAFASLTGVRPPLDAPPPPRRAPKAYFVSVGRLRDQGLRCETPIASAVRETAAFCIAHRDSLGGAG